MHFYRIQHNHFVTSVLYGFFNLLPLGILKRKFLPNLIANICILNDKIYNKKLLIGIIKDSEHSNTSLIREVYREKDEGVK